MNGTKITISDAVNFARKVKLLGLDFITLTEDIGSFEQCFLMSTDQVRNLLVFFIDINAIEEVSTEHNEENDSGGVDLVSFFRGYSVNKKKLDAFLFAHSHAQANYFLRSILATSNEDSWIEARTLCGILKMSPQSNEVHLGEQVMRISPKTISFKYLLMLAKANKEIVAYSQFCRKDIVSKTDIRSINHRIKNLRTFLNKNKPRNGAILSNVSNAGYRLI
jgi:hypothetical protein